MEEKRDPSGTSSAADGSAPPPFGLNRFELSELRLAQGGAGEDRDTLRFVYKEHLVVLRRYLRGWHVRVSVDVVDMTDIVNFWASPADREAWDAIRERLFFLRDAADEEDRERYLQSVFGV